MKSLFFRFCLLACITLFNVACSSHERLLGNEFLIEGEVSDIEDGTIINLIRWDNDFGMNIASDTVRNGRFIFKEETVSDSERLTIMSYGEGFPLMSLGVWVAPKAKVKIKGKGKLYPVWEVKSAVPYQKEENRYTNKNRDVIAEMARISVERNAVLPKLMAVSSRDEALPYRKIIDSLDQINNSLNTIEIFAQVEIMEKTNISPIWLDKMQGVAMTVRYAKADDEYLDELRKKAEGLYGRMSEEDKTTPSGYRITSYLFPPPIVGVGDDMVDADFFDINGNTKHLSDYSGKYLLLDFWSSGCGPCIMALPEMKEISETYSEKLTIVSISFDSDAGWKEAMATHDMPWVNIRDPKSFGGLAANYGVSGIPHYVIISPENKIVDKWFGYGNGLIKKKISEHVK